MREEACSADTIIRDEDALREPYVREGEQTLTKIIDALKSGTDLSTVKNIAYKKGREFVITPKERASRYCGTWIRPHTEGFPPHDALVHARSMLASSFSKLSASP